VPCGRGESGRHNSSWLETRAGTRRAGIRSFFNLGVSRRKRGVRQIRPGLERWVSQLMGGQDRPMNIHFHRATPGGIADDAALEQLQKQWATYQKLVDADALSHNEVGTVLHDTLKAIHLPFAF